MATVIRERQTTASLRCPWCRTAGEREEWVVCLQDRTPVHARCLKEFGSCSTCRTPASEKEHFAPRPRRSGGIAGRIRLQEVPARGLKSRRQTIPALPVPVLEALTTMKQEYSGWLGSWGGALLWLGVSLTASALCWPFSGWGAAAIAGISLPALAFLRLLLRLPRASRWLQDKAGSRQRGLAGALVQLDSDAQREYEAYTAASAAFRASRAELQSTESGRRGRYQESLLARVSVAEAMEMPGIGPTTIATLERAGIQTLSSLRSLEVEDLYGIGPLRAALLQAWAREARAEVERQALRGGFPGQEAVDGLVDSQLASIRRQGQRELAKAEAACEKLVVWRRAREQCKSALEAS